MLSARDVICSQMVGGAKPRMRAGVGTSLLVAAENGLAGLALLQSERAVAMRHYRNALQLAMTLCKQR